MTKYRNTRNNPTLTESANKRALTPLLVFLTPVTNIECFQNIDLIAGYQIVKSVQNCLPHFSQKTASYLWANAKKKCANCLNTQLASKVQYLV